MSGQANASTWLVWFDRKRTRFYACCMRWLVAFGLALGLAGEVSAATPEASPAVEVTCAGIQSLADFIQLTDAGEEAFRNLDVEALNRAAQEARDMVPCLGDRVRPTDAAAFHRLQALSAFAGRDESAALREFYAARRLEPGWTGIAEVAPAGHPLLALYEQSLTAVESQFEAIQAPSGGFVNVDGIRGAPRSLELSSIVQFYASDTHLLRTVFLEAGQALPMTEQARTVGREEGSKQALFWRLALVDAVGALGCYALSVHYRQRFEDESTAYQDLESLQGRTNALFASSAIMGTTAIVLGATAVVRW